MTKKLFVKTHGCQMNEYDSAKMIDLLKAEEDFELVIYTFCSQHNNTI